MRDELSFEFLLRLIEALEVRMVTMSETTQEKIDALTATVTGIDAKVAAAKTAIMDEIAALQAANPSADFTKLNAAVAQLGTDVDAVAAIPPAAPAAP
jgi:outer membrane murein-binding lipoprotein Lpp